jgi:hypothetical protein
MCLAAIYHSTLLHIGLPVTLFSTPGALTGQPKHPRRLLNLFVNLQNSTIIPHTTSITLGPETARKSDHDLSKRASTISGDEWAMAVLAGDSLAYLMRMRIEDAEKSGMAQSAFKDPALLPAYGWMIQKPSVDVANLVPFKQLSSPVLARSASDWSVHRVRHSMMWSYHERNGRVSWGHLCNQWNRLTLDVLLAIECILHYSHQPRCSYPHSDINVHVLARVYD